MTTEKKFDIYGGYSGLVLLARGVDEQELRRRFEAFLAKGDDGSEFRAECNPYWPEPK